MLWYKAWLETRWRFLIGLALLTCSAAATVLAYPQVAQLIPLINSNVRGPIGDAVREAAQLSRDFRGYIWLQWFRQNDARWTSFFVILLGTATTFGSQRGQLFTLSLPVSRARLLGTRALLGLAESSAIAFLPSLLIPLLAPSIGSHYGLGAVLIHSACIFIASSVFFCTALLLSTFFDDPWPPLLLTIVIAFLAAWSGLSVMSGACYFQTGAIPWLGLVIAAAISSALFAAALVNIQRRDF
ncbi:MAG TPA: hypothetical protein VII75_09525 [Thermoanaerobaculia bacterium]|nr:hypothetical protein [Thermoanaerobaculia bacterium]